MTAIPIASDKTEGHTPRKPSMPFSDDVRRKLLIVFFAALVLPIQPELGGLRLDPSRLLLLAVFFPFALALAKRRAGGFNLIDGLMACYAAWIIITLIYNHGMARFAYASISATMLIGGYMAGRLLIRNAQDYRQFIRYFLILLLIFLPFTIFELITQRMIIAETLGQFFPAIAKYYETRYGLSRVQVVFPHSILFGLFCSIGFGNVLYIYRNQFLGRLARLALISGMTIMSLSSAPLLSIGLQSIMAGWDKVTHGKWMILACGTGAIYGFLSLASNRGPVVILIEKLTFNPSTAWWRVYIWEYGVQNVMAHPLFGLGLNDWARPTWLAPTVDNFWLLTAMQAGIPALAFLVMALVIHVFRIVRVKGLDSGTRDIRTGYLLVLVGTAFTISTVHIWDSMAIFVMFYMGAGSFLYTSTPENVTKASEDVAPLRALRYQRNLVGGHEVGPRALSQYSRLRNDEPINQPASGAPNKNATTVSRSVLPPKYARSTNLTSKQRHPKSTDDA